MRGLFLLIVVIISREAPQKVKKKFKQELAAPVDRKCFSSFATHCPSMKSVESYLFRLVKLVMTREQKKDVEKRKKK